MTKRLTQKQAEIITCATGVMMFHELSPAHAAIERRMGRPVWTHEITDPALWAILKAGATTELQNIAADGSNGWVKCSDDLPQPGSNAEFLVIANGSCTIATMEYDWVMECPYWQNEDLDRLQDVTHWQELPELPA